MTQLETIKELLIKNGKISRNQCLRDFISCRLSAYILDLKHSGWEFNAHNEGGDYVYEVVKRPEEVKIVARTDYKIFQAKLGFSLPPVRE